jgi:DNA-binding CsgD family transcriptional regulator
MPSRSHRLHALSGAIGAAAEAASLEELAATAFPQIDASLGILFGIKPDPPMPVALGEQAAARTMSAEPHFAAREAVEMLADRAGRSGGLALDTAGRVLWMSSRARVLLGHGPLAPLLVYAARRLAQTVLARAVEAAPLELRVHFKVDARVAVDAELSIARTLSGERIVAVGLEQTDPPRAQVAAAAMRFALTVAEADVLAMMANGLSNAAIARRFGIALPTVKTHVHRVIQKMAVTSRLQAVLLARKLN